MSRRKGLSLEEKRTKMMEIFFEEKDFFQLKELEKIAPKKKGIITQSVKDVVQSLVDDAMVDTDKIGTCVYFWAFPSKATAIRRSKLDNIDERVKEAKRRLKSAQERMAQAQVGREEGDGRAALLERIAAAENQRNLLTQEIQKFRDCDPEVIEQMKKETQIATDAVNRWTDNIFSIKSWCKNKFCIAEDTLNKQFSIPEELDYV
ncbi:unnamed protein product [Meganyctiphanes norvegica]|uniref:Meiotic nuclear division protein 1 homolog n=1 Tax=Meganyctiphanes norvegica TaxID=48144 RepID=A0AAV2PH62_MEGNR